MAQDSTEIISRSSLTDGFAPGAPDESRRRRQEELRPLKEAMLSLEWEMRRETLGRAAAAIQGLVRKNPGDQVIDGLGRILLALVKYLAASGSTAHPLAVKFFFGVYNGLEKVYLAPSLTPAARKKLLLAAAQRYRLIRQRLQEARRPASVIDDLLSTRGPAPASTTTATQAQDLEGILARPAKPAPPPPTEKSGAGGDVAARLDAFFGDGGEQRETDASGVVPLEVGQEPAAAGDGGPPTSPPPAKKSSAGGDVAARLDAFFGDGGEQRETDASGVVPLEVGQEPAAAGDGGPPASPPPAEKSGAGGDVAARLDAFFGDGGGQQETDASGVVPLAMPAAPPGDGDGEPTASPAPGSGVVADVTAKLDAFFGVEEEKGDTGAGGVVPLGELPPAGPAGPGGEEGTVADPAALLARVGTALRRPQGGDTALAAKMASLAAEGGKKEAERACYLLLANLLELAGHLDEGGRQRAQALAEEAMGLLQAAGAPPGPAALAGLFSRYCRFHSQVVTPLLAARPSARPAGGGGFVIEDVTIR